MKTLAREELEASNKYWLANYNEKVKSIDKLCVDTAERLGKIDYEIWKDKTNNLNMNHETLEVLLVERTCLESILIHFHGFVDKDYVKGHDLSPESIKRHDSRSYRYYNNILGA
jgi:hypothetical protein